MKLLHYKSSGPHYELSSGRRFYANSGLLSVGPGDDGLSEGYDGHVDEHDDDYNPLPFTPGERREIAEYVIALWRGWAETGVAPDPNA